HLAAVESDRRGDARDREIEGVPIAELEIRTAPPGRVRQRHRDDNVVATDREVADAVLAVELREIELATAVRVLDRDLRAERDERRHRVSARDRETARARRRDAAHHRWMRLHAVALGAAPEERLVVPIAARVEAEVPADRSHVPQ